MCDQYDTTFKPACLCIVDLWITLDTSVIAELRKVKSGIADNNVVSWVNNVSALRALLSVLTSLELETSVLSG